MKKFLLTAAVIGAGMYMTAGVANAASVSNTLYKGLQQISDNSAEYLINADPQATDTTVDVGDKLRGILRIETTEAFPLGNNVSRDLSSGGVNELTAIFELEVTGKTSLGAAGWAFTFGTSASFAAEVEGYGWADGTNAVAAFFEDSNYEFTRGTIAAGEASVTNGQNFWLAGLDGPNDFWTAIAISDDITAIGSAPAPGNGGTFNFGATLLDVGIGPDLKQVNCLTPNGVQLVSFCGSGSLLATGGSGTEFDSFDNVDIVINTVPEPASLALFGLGLLGLGAAAARRRKAA